ncbi:MAG: right-handed parallel beta-helix repeat-containing protein, partial [Planctomycetota bacterium]
MFRKLSFLMAFVLALSLAMPAVATDYYLDAVSGDDDTGDGSFGSPWKTFANIMTYERSFCEPPGYVNLQAGDTIYLMNGTYDEPIHVGSDSGCDTGPQDVAFFDNENGTEANPIRIMAYPGHSPVIDAKFLGRGIRLMRSSWFEIQGLEMIHGTPAAITLGCDNIKIHDVYIHDNNGTDCQGGISSTQCSGVEIYDSIFHDNFDPLHMAGTNIIIFGGATIRDCEFYQEQPTSPYPQIGIRSKHGSPDPNEFFHVYNNTFTDIQRWAFQTGTGNTHFHHNLIVRGGDAIQSFDGGGTTHQTNQLFEYNTVYGTASVGFTFNPTISHLSEDYPSDPMDMVFQNNIVYDLSTSYNRGVVAVGHYMSEQLYYLTIPSLTFSNNCYYNPNIAVQFDFAASDNEPQGDYYTFAEWQSTYGYDLDSVEADPLFVDAENGDFNLQGSSPAAGMGVYAGLGPQPPTRASNPRPTRDETDVSVDITLKWNSGHRGVDSHDVYLGTDSTPDSGEFQGNVAAGDFSMIFDPGTLASGTTYYWRIDEINAQGTATGNVWNFTTTGPAPPPGQASNPSPADSATDINIDADLSWTAGSGATSSDVYFGTDATPDAGEFQGNQTATTFEPGTMAPDTTYYWRIDEVNAQGTTTGSVWSFTTEGTAYYLDAVNGDDDTGDGSFGNPWKSFKNIMSYYQASYRPPGWIDIAPGDTIYLMNGTYDELLYYGGSGGPNQNGPYIAGFRNEAGDSGNIYKIKAYPGHSPVMDAQELGMGIRIWSCSWWEIDGIEIINGIPWGISLEGANYVKVHNVHIHDGIGYDNAAGLHSVGCVDVEIYDSIFHDNHDPDKVSSFPIEGGSNIIIFGGTTGKNWKVHDCQIYQSEPFPTDLRQVGMKCKHGSRIPDGTFEVYNNTFTDCRAFSFQTGTANTHFHHNLIVGGGDMGFSIRSHDGGGVTHQTNQTFEYNTVYDAPGFVINPTLDWRNAEFPDDPTNINFNNNIVYGTDVIKLELGRYMSDELYFIMLDEFHSNYNCFYEPNQVAQEYLIAANNQTTQEGGSYTLSEWQTNFGWDLNSTESDPLFVDAPNGDFHLQGGSPAAGMGMYGDAGPTPPGQASNPNPANSATDVSVTADLSWSAGSGATSHDVYFGTSSPGASQGNQTATTFDTGTMSNNTTYYWRIDEINANGTTTGTVWSFTTEAVPSPPGQASNPSPTDSATDVSITADLSWTAGSGATSHDVYFGTSSPGASQGNQTATTFDTGTMAESTTYYWRIDEVNAQGTTTGNVWSFTTGTAPSQLVITNLWVANSKPYEVVDGGLAVGAVQCIDRSYTFDTIPGWLVGETYIKTAMDDKQITGDNFLSFDTNQDVAVYVAHDDRITPKPTWLQSFVDIGDDILCAGATYSLYEKDYPQGTVMLGGNGGQSSSTAMYTVVIVGQGIPSPGQANSPDPADSATDVSVDADLSWTAGTGATSHDVYFGTSSPGAFQGNQTDTTFDPGTLSYDVTYYWRIDEINTGGTTTGVVWSFTTEAAPTPPGQATNPDPADSATDVSIAADLSWTAGTNSTSSDVYFGTTSPGSFQGNQTATTFDPGALGYDTTYYWRIDEINTGGTTTGNVWSFTTAQAPAYECDNWQSLHPEWIFCDDFESTDPMVGTGRYFEYNDDGGEFVPVAGIGVDNSKAMRVIWQSAETEAGNLKLGFGRNPSGYMDKGIRNTEDFRDVYYRFYMKMEDGWQGNPSKLSRATVIAASDWSQAMIAHHWGSGAYYLSIDPVSCVDASSQVVCVGYNDFGNFEWLGAQTGTMPIFDSDNDDMWHYIEHHVKLNDPGQSNGITEFWIDGTLDARRDNLDFVTSYTDYAINAIFLENSWGAGSPQLQERYMDSFVVSTQPIGEWTGGGPTPPGQASNPSPADSSADVAVDADLSWTAGTGSTSSDVYFGTTSPGTFQGNQTETTFDTGTMANDT